MRDAAGDLPGPAGAEDPFLAGDDEAELAGDDEAVLLGRMSVLRDDRARIELHDGEGQPLSLDAPRPDAFHDLDRLEIRKIGKIRHATVIIPAAFRAPDRSAAPSTAAGTDRA